MIDRKRLLPLVLVLAAAAILAVLLLIPRLHRADTLTGYIEGEPLYFAAPLAGAVKAVFVERGDQVATGAPLFAVDPEQPRGQRDQAAADLAQAQAQAVDARKGERPVELAILEANAAAAEAAARNAAVQLRRVEILEHKGFSAPAQLDDAREAAKSANARLASARKQRAAAALGARQDQIRAADARVSAAQAALVQAEARLGEMAPKAPGAARVEDVFFRPGEWAAANQPIVSLLPDARVRLRFFVPERSLSAYRVGRTVRFSCDGCAKDLTARIVFVSPRAEFTPPVIYSRDSRDRLVYLVEGLPNRRLNPGQPVDVQSLEPGT